MHLLALASFRIRLAVLLKWSYFSSTAKGLRYIIGKARRPMTPAPGQEKTRL